MTEPTATARRVGRVTWAVEVDTGDGMTWGPAGGSWFVHGATPAHAERRAQRRARQVLAKYLLVQERNASPRIITVDDLEDR